jgi:hypothetical protein
MLGTMTVNEWRARLADNFTVGGLVGGNLVQVQEREAEVAEYLVKTFGGQNTLIDSFQSFYIETLNIAMRGVVENGWPDAPSNYALVFAQFSTLFRRYRACELLSFNGYPLDGYSLLRDIKDRAFMLAGLAHNMTTVLKIMGTVPMMADKVAWKRRSTRSRKDEENRITRHISGADSGLPPTVVAELRLWDELFHEEVHGGKLSLTHEIGFFSQGFAMPVGPTLHEQAFAVYMNRSSELGWLILRLLPYLQVAENAFDNEWQRKYAVLDESFRYIVQGLTKLGKTMGQTFITLVDKKFSFKQPFKYFEADGSV